MADDDDTGILSGAESEDHGPTLSLQSLKNLQSVITLLLSLGLVVFYPFGFLILLSFDLWSLLGLGAFDCQLPLGNR